MSHAVKRISNHNNDEYHQMVWLGRCFLGDSIGRIGNGGSTYWAEAICNNPSCRAKTIVDVAAWAEIVRLEGGEVNG